MDSQPRLSRLVPQRDRRRPGSLARPRCSFSRLAALAPRNAIESMVDINALSGSRPWRHDMIPSAYRWRRWESNPTRGDALTLRGHSVFPRIAVKGTQPDLLLPYPVVPWNAPACPALWSLFGHQQVRRERLGVEMETVCPSPTFARSGEGRRLRTGGS